MHKQDCCGQYRGSMSIREIIAGENTGFQCLGNSTLNVTQTVENLSAPNYQSFGGSACNMSTITAMGLSLTLNCTDLDNLKLAFGGDIVEESGNVTDEEHTYIEGSCIIPTNTISNPNEDLTVADDVSGGDPTSYTEGEDYIRVPGGIEILESGSIEPDDVIYISYSVEGSRVLNFNTVSGREFEFLLSGRKHGPNSTRPVVLRIWKVKIDPVADFAMIGDGLVTLALTGQISEDPTKTAGSTWAQIQDASAYETV